MFDEFDNLDDLDDFGAPDDDIGLDPTNLDPEAIPSTVITPQLVATSEDWSDVDLDSWLDDVPEPASLPPAAIAEPQPSPEVSSTAPPAPLPAMPISTETLDENFDDDWFTGARRHGAIKR